MVWTVRNGYRFFEDKSEYEVNRMFRIRGNNAAMVESGMISPGAPFPNFTRQEWDEYLATIVRYEEAVARYELGLEEYEVMEEEEYSSVESHNVPSSKKKQKVSHDGSKQQVRNEPKLSKDLNLTLFKKDFGVNRVPGVNPKNRKRYTESIASAVKELMTHSEPRPVYGPHCSAPDFVVPLIEEVEMNKEMTESFHLLNNRDNLSDKQVLEQLRVSVKAYKAKRKVEEAAAAAELPQEVVADHESPAVTPITIEVTDSPCPPDIAEDDSHPEIIVNKIPEDTTTLESESQPQEAPSTPQQESPGSDFEWLAKITPDPDNPGEYMIRRSPSPSVNTRSSSHNLTNPLDEAVVYMMPPKHNYPVKPNLDYVQPPSLPPDPPSEPPFEPLFEPSSELISEPLCLGIAEEPLLDNTIKDTGTKKKAKGLGRKGSKKSKVKDKNLETEEMEKKKGSRAVVKKSGDRQSSRLTKRVSYAEPEVLEDVHFWCWRCKGDVVNECDKHGGLIPCPEVITAPGTKNPLTFPTPSFIAIRRSEIRDAGFGAFATAFIKPGVILGEYKGKVIKSKDYAKIKESGYAWQVSNNEGTVSYIDGANHRASNWLKFVNCCRGEIEQNTISRLNQGQIEYYSYKPIPIGQELKIFYGLKYFEDLGYDPTPDHDQEKKGEVYACTKCNKQWTDKQYLDKHLCQSNKQFKCTHCDKQYAKKDNLTAHIKAAHLGQGHQCKQCGKQFSRAGTLRQHISSVHEGVKKFNCPFCYYSTNQKPVLTRHVNTHTNTKPHQCPHCEYSGVTVGNLSRHIRLQHTNKKYPCKYNGCNVKCYSEEELMSHYQTHPKRQYQCGECPMSFDVKWYLSSHTATHTGEKRYQCEYCDKKFTRCESLTTHILIHTGVKEFKCDNCEYQCNCKGSLTRHIKSKVCFKK